MARPLRIEYAGALYHLTSRGDRREDIYLDDIDRVIFLEVLAGVCERFCWVCHAYCLMSNHYHLLIETRESTLSQGMRQLNGVFTQRSNHRHHRVGHVFQGRYKAILVQKESYLLELARYVVLNPVRAGMVRSANERGVRQSLACMMALMDDETPLGEIPTTQRRPPPKPLDYYIKSNRDRDKAIAAAYGSGGYSMKVIGEHFALSYSMVSRIVKREVNSQ